MKSKLNHIVILEGETRSGKTTTLQNYFKGKPNVRGFLTPDLNGVRKLYTLSDDAFHEFETASGEADKTIAIGRFHFYKDAFETGRNALQDFPKKLTFWMLVDEWGPLESSGKGFEPNFSVMIQNIEEHSMGVALVVVRKSLVSAFAEKYGTPALVIEKSVLQKCEYTAAVVLCGGLSSRMGTAKALIEYQDGLPQYLAMVRLTKNLCNRIFVAHGSVTIPKSSEYELIADVQADQGPAAGVLAAFRQQNEHLLVCGCDYPLLHLVDLLALFAEDDHCLAVCYADESAAFADPLLCFYHRACLPLMEKWYEAGNRSLRHFISTIPHVVLNATEPNRIKSIDTPSQLNTIKRLLNGAD